MAKLDSELSLGAEGPVLLDECKEEGAEVVRQGQMWQLLLAIKLVQEVPTNFYYRGDTLEVKRVLHTLVQVRANDGAVGTVPISFFEDGHLKFVFGPRTNEEVFKKVLEEELRNPPPGKSLTDWAQLLLNVVLNDKAFTTRLLPSKKEGAMFVQHAAGLLRKWEAER